MAHTNSTANKHLPQFVDDDKPSWLGDVNSAYATIDAAFTTNELALATANASILALQNSLAALTARVTTLEGH